MIQCYDSEDSSKTSSTFTQLKHTVNKLSVHFSSHKPFITDFTHNAQMLSSFTSKLLVTVATATDQLVPSSDSNFFDMMVCYFCANTNLIVLKLNVIEPKVWNILQLQKCTFFETQFRSNTKDEII